MRPGAVRRGLSRFILVLLVAVLGGTTANLQAQVIVGQNKIRFDREQAIRSIFQPDDSLEEARDHCQRRLDLELRAIERSGSLSEDQKMRLNLAGSGDIERFFQRYDEFERTTEFGEIEMQEWQRFWPEINRLRSRYRRGLHGANSLLAKNLPCVLEETHLAAYEADVAQRRRLEYEKRFAIALVVIERRLPLTHKQRTHLTKVVMEKTEPPKFWPEAHAQFQLALVMLRIHSVPEADLKPIFTEDEWKVMSSMIDPAIALKPAIEQQIGELP